MGGPRVLFIEDDEVLREGVAASLRSSGYDVRALSDGVALAGELDAFDPQVAVLDVGLGDGPDGFALGSLLAARDDGPPFVFLTAAGAIEDRLRGFDLGADDYIVKPFSTRELESRLRVILRRRDHEARGAGGVAPDDPATSPGDLTIVPAERIVRRAGVDLRLTPTEYDLLVALRSEPGRVWSKPDLIAEVWGTDDRSPHTVEVYVSSLRRKLEEHGPRIVLTHREGGYSLQA